MNILFITNLFPFKGNRKISRVLREFVEEWGKKGHNIKVIRLHFKHQNETIPNPPNFNIDKNIVVEFIKPFRVPLLKYNFYSQKKVINNLPFKPQIIICHLPNAYFLFHKLAQKLQVPLIIGIHMSDIKLSKNPFYKWRQKKIFKNADAFACRSYAIQKQFIQQFPAFKNKTFPALSGIPKTFINMEPNKRINPQRFKIITVVTRLVKRKNINKVLTALSSLSADNITNWQYTIIGRYHKETDLYGLLNKLNLNDKVNFLGHLDREAVIKELLDSDIFIMPSSPETFGLAYLESMACGCITIGSINEGIDGIIKDGENGLLCDPYNLNSIKEKLYTAMTLSEKDREKIINESLKTVENFSIEQKAQEYLDQLKKHIS